MRQAMRMRYLADGVVLAGKVAVADFVCPTEETRKEFAPDYTVWLNTIKKSEYEDTNKIFEDPFYCDYRIDEWFDDTHIQLMEVVKTWMKRNFLFDDTHIQLMDVAKKWTKNNDF